MKTADDTVALSGLRGRAERQRAAQALEWFQMQDRLGRMERKRETNTQQTNKATKEALFCNQTIWEVPQQFSNGGATC